MDALACDTFRATKQFDRRATFRQLRYSPTFRPIATLRWFQSSSGFKRKIIRKLHLAVCRRAGIDLPAETSIGPGFAIFHGWGIVISGGAKLGSNISVLQGVTIGQADRISRDGSRTSGFPIIEDDVWIGPHAVIVGDVTIGKGTRILAGAVVTTDIPAGSLVAGNPSSIIRENVVEDVMNKVPLGDWTGGLSAA